jgi:hypothetical protein
MKSNVQLLFDLQNLEKRKTPNQKEFEDNNLEFLLFFKDSVFSAHKKLHQKISRCFSLAIWIKTYRRFL